MLPKAADGCHATSTVDSGPLSPLPRSMHRRQKSLTNSNQPIPFPKPKPQAEQSEYPTPEKMTTYINYSTMRLKPVKGSSSNYQGIIDFLEEIEAQAEVECRDDEN